MGGGMVVSLSYTFKQEPMGKEEIFMERHGLSIHTGSEKEVQEIVMVNSTTFTSLIETDYKT